MIKRIEELIQYLEISLNKFEDSINASRGSISGAIKNDRNIGSNVIEKILQKYSISSEWLTRGIGEMYISTDETIREPEAVYMKNGDQKLIKDLLLFFELKTKAELTEFINKVNEKKGIANTNKLGLLMERLEILVAENKLEIGELKEELAKVKKSS